MTRRLRSGQVKPDRWHWVTEAAVHGGTPLSRTFMLAAYGLDTSDGQQSICTNKYAKADGKY